MLLKQREEKSNLHALSCDACSLWKTAVTLNCITDFLRSFDLYSDSCLLVGDCLGMTMYYLFTVIMRSIFIEMIVEDFNLQAMVLLKKQP